jgi:hypothetical protein
MICAKSHTAGEKEKGEDFGSKFFSICHDLGFVRDLFEAINTEIGKY